ncbi:MAG: FixH family protein [Methylovirgula sp.]
MKRAAAAVLAAALSIAALSPALADIKDFEFQLVQSQVKKGDGTILSARLIDKRSGKAVPDAVIFATRIDMAPDEMPTMTAPIETLPSTEPGIYRFKTDLTAPGGWQLSLAAKIQGETGTLKNKLVLKVVP